MPFANFVTTVQNGQPILPDMDALQWTDKDDVLHGGWSCVSESPAPGRKTIVVRVETTAAQIVAMSKDARFRLVETVSADLAAERAAPLAKADADAFVAWLSAANAAPVAAKAMPTKDRLLDEVCAFHGVPRLLYNAACHCEEAETPAVVVEPEEPPKPKRTPWISPNDSLLDRAVKECGLKSEGLPLWSTEDEYFDAADKRIRAVMGDPPGDPGPQEVRTMYDTDAPLSRDVKLTLPDDVRRELDGIAKDFKKPKRSRKR